MQIKVLGAGCSKCQSTVAMIERVARVAGVEVQIVKVENHDDIRTYGVSATPAVVIDGVVRHSGGVPPHEKVQSWLVPSGQSTMGFLTRATRHLFFTGKGGVGKTTVAAALALGLVQRGKTVHLSPTDPAAHLAGTLDAEVAGLKVDRIDPKVETQRYIDKIMATKSAGLNAEEQALLLEDLRSPCTEEVAVFHAFSRIVSEAAALL